MIVSKEVEVKLSSNTYKYYEELGYYIPRYYNEIKKKTVYKKGTIINVKVKDLLPYSKAIIILKCDYCGNEYPSKYENYIKYNINGNIHKDACKNCSHIKYKEAAILLYGVENCLKVPEIRNKVKQTCLERYGSKSYFGTQIFKEKIKIDCLEKYGYEHYSQIPEVINKIKEAQNLDINFVKEQFKIKGYYLLTEKYINNLQPLEYLCLKHIDKGTQVTKYTNLYGAEEVCTYCVGEKRSEIHRHDYNFVKSIFESKGLTLLENNYINSRQNLAYICKKHPEKIQYISFNALYNQNQNCPLCAIEGRSGENHYNWKGGITDLHNFLRLRLLTWKKDSIKNCGYKCAITGERFDDIHHLYSFNLIIKETLKELNFDLLSKTSEYTDDELRIIEEKFLEVHNRYPLGICLTEKVHRLYHVLYGDNNTPEQFEEFKIRYFNNEFMDILSL